ncbi:uncharacterized protein LOC132700326 isoform X2 [Cylas formicarius]|uniref:uncharacterized protein LOC132700326 isoform X2 n=1 Tax=Cylas formicarius TaxID=197179 RepID=UPI0029589F40|nr:uncharacterized protein LOC132700326 isoform X2 [Cylas formicarius]
MKVCRSNSTGGTVLLLIAATLVLSELSSVNAAPHVSSYPGYYSSLEGQNPEYLLQTLARLRQALYADDDLENLLIQEENYVPPEHKRSLLPREREFSKYFLNILDDDSGTAKRMPDLGLERGHSGSQEHALHMMNRLG